MGIFYTKKGDQGQSYVGKIAIDKTSIDIEVLGALDELNCLIGMTKHQYISKQQFVVLESVQEDLFIIQANIAGLMLNGKFPVPTFPQNKTSSLEELVDQYEAKLVPALKFVIPGTTPSSAWLDYCRTKTRQVEVLLWKLNRKKKVAPEIMSYLNRLSSLFFALARTAAKNKKEKHPKYK